MHVGVLVGTTIWASWSTTQRLTIRLCVFLVPGFDVKSLRASHFSPKTPLVKCHDDRSHSLFRLVSIYASNCSRKLFDTWCCEPFCEGALIADHHDSKVLRISWLCGLRFALLVEIWPRRGKTRTRERNVNARVPKKKVLPEMSSFVQLSDFKRETKNFYWHTTWKKYFSVLVWTSPATQTGHYFLSPFVWIQFFHTRDVYKCLNFSVCSHFGFLMTGWFCWRAIFMSEVTRHQTERWVCNGHLAFIENGQTDEHGRASSREERMSPDSGFHHKDKDKRRKTKSWSG